MVGEGTACAKVLRLQRKWHIHVEISRNKKYVEISTLLENLVMENNCFFKDLPKEEPDIKI